MFIILLWLRVPGEVSAHMRSDAEEALSCLLCLLCHGYLQLWDGERGSSSLPPCFPFFFFFDLLFNTYGIAKSDFFFNDIEVPHQLNFRSPSSYDPDVLRRGLK